MHNVETFWDKFAYQKEQIPIQTIAKIRKYLNGNNDIVLDYGCAIGTIANEIALNAREIYGIDISQKMISVAKTKAIESKNINAHFLQSTIFDKQFKEESFDVILALNILHLVENIPKVMQRLFELLKNGGVIISATACIGEKRTFLGLLLFLLSKIGIVPKINVLKPIDLEIIFIDQKLELIETSMNFQGMYSYLIIAKKNMKT